MLPTPTASDANMNAPTYSSPLNKAIGAPVYVDNDANVMTLAELHRGAGRCDKNLVCVTLGTGVGGGIIIDGKIYRGSTSSAGELGHIPINAANATVPQFHPRARCDDTCLI